MKVNQRSGSLPRLRNAVASLFALLGILAQSALAASSVEVSPDGAITWQAGVNGVEIEFGTDGKVARIYSKYAHPVTIADRRGIQTATIIAEEKAKAEIIRFLEQDVATGRIIEEVEDTLSTTRQESTGTAQNVTAVAQRAVIQSLLEVTTSSSSGLLRGVVMLESGYDKDSREAWVVVGVSEKSMRAAGAVQQLLDSTAAPAEVASPAEAPEATSSGSSDGAPSSHIRRGNSDF